MQINLTSFQIKRMD
ncbi:hypothetical protein QLX08_003149 [Tetragonisca angustula]|uniref:Uncharacterized protein n=1 Tax=Tetragonisca angustula TaxID=166442 RepID=A0AAW1A829_9HYME